MGRSLLVLVMIAACTKSNPGATCPDGTCSDPRFPYCDATGAIGGTPGTCIAVSCQPGEVHSCDEDQAWTCNATGDGYDLTACALGCNDDPAPHCRYLQPRYLPEVCDTPADMDQLAITTSGMLDPNLDQTCTGGVVTQTGGPDLCVMHYGSITIANGATLTITGQEDTTGRAVALVADEDAVIEGVLDVSGHVHVNGPGGGAFSSGTHSSSSGSDTLNGGGGAGGATAGGPGGSGPTAGNGGTDGGAQNGGGPTMNPALLAALIGGGSTFHYDGKTVGGAGGGLTVISCRGSVRVTGTINAGGGGGAGGMFLIAGNLPGEGGGAGGNVVLQGTNVSITGQLFANGGGGGGGVHEGIAGSDGEDGSLSDESPARGGGLAGNGAGGVGGFAGAEPGPGEHPAATNSSSGGGGGSVGFLQVYVPENVTPTLTPSHVSPALQPTGTALTR